jgi:hypothetical protein
LALQSGFKPAKAFARAPVLAVLQTASRRPRLAEKRPDACERVALWNETCACYYARDWDGVLERLDRMQALWPEDRLAQLYRDRADRHRREPPPADRTGVERAKTK